MNLWEIAHIIQTHQLLTLTNLTGKTLLHRAGEGHLPYLLRSA